MARRVLFDGALGDLEAIDLLGMSVKLFRLLCDPIRRLLMTYRRYLAFGLAMVVGACSTDNGAANGDNVDSAAT